jgi:hypothetical protein
VSGHSHGQAVAAESSAVACGGWTAEEHSLFVASRLRARQMAAGSSSGGNSGAPAAVMEKLALLMPGKSPQELKEHEAW